MFRVAIDQLQPGMRVGRSVCDASGRVLLAAGTELRGPYIERLRQLGVPAIYVWDELAPDVEPEDVVQPETRQRLSAELKQTMIEIRGALAQEGESRLRRWRLSSDRIRTAVNSVVDEILANRNAVVQLQDIRTHDEYTMGHSVNVCVLSLLIGASLGYDVGRLRDLGMGAVLHDIGKVTVPEEILNKVGPLTPEEMEEMRKHAERGFEILRQQPDISLLSAHVAFQHHERWCGGGYPRGLKGPEIHEFARVVAVADVYDAMTADRVYRKGYSPERALRNMREMIADWFEPRVLEVFVDHIALYPVGTLVELNSGQVAVVLEVTHGQPDRPRVRVVQEADGSRPNPPYDLELVRDRSLSVARTLREPGGDSEPTRRSLDTAAI